ncbi:MAG TPA: hypothetical protein VK054_10855 [Beutenbergiaceae bacterium]|nr:hypothetical protein [Beutenbergiaceae bacterium]
MNPCHNYYCPNSSFKVGTITDPHYGEPVEVWARATFPSIGYKKANGHFGDLSTPESDAAWPEHGIYQLYTSNGRNFHESHTDRDGWWITIDTVYLPLTRNPGRWSLFFQGVGVGLSNGFPARDVLAFSFPWLLPKRVRWRLWDRQARRREGQSVEDRLPRGQECGCETVA